VLLSTHYGAVRLRDGRFFFRPETGKFNALTCWEFLKELCATSTRTARQVVVITDNARYHHARLHRDWRQQEAERFRLDFLPPYSPELDPTERIWKLTRRLCVHNRYFPSLNDAALAVETEFADDPLCYRSTPQRTGTLEGWRH
jgi:hypothetical protein